jgi:hypothetical protein
MDGKLDNDYNYQIVELVYLDESRFYPQFCTKNKNSRLEPCWIAIKNEKTNLSFDTTYQEAYKTLKIYRDNCEKIRVRERIVHPVTF